jgi:hypothetical protein
MHSRAGTAPRSMLSSGPESDVFARRVPTIIWEEFERVVHQPYIWIAELGACQHDFFGEESNIRKAISIATFYVQSWESNQIAYKRTENAITSQEPTRVAGF